MIRMRRPVSTSLTFSCLLFTMSLMALAFDVQPVRAEPTTWTVDDDGPADFHKIQEAIDAAISGDTISVLNGIYFETITVNKRNLTLVGQGRSATIIDGNKTNNVVRLTARNCTVKNFSIRNSRSNVWGEKFGGFLVSSSNNTISYNTVINNEYGIYLLDSRCNNVHHNNITKNDVGVYVDGSSNNQIEDCTITNNNEGIHIEHSSSNKILANIIKSNRYGVIFSSFADKNEVIYNNIADSERHGVELGYTRAEGNDISFNTINSNGGVGVSAAMEHTRITSNHIFLNSEGGIYLDFLGVSGNCMVSSNWITSNGGYGIDVWSDYNLIYNNYFNNSKNANEYDKAYRNSWNVGKTFVKNIVGGPCLGGNFWSDYTGYDYDGDGIGDTEYRINWSVDHLPLVFWGPQWIIACNETAHEKKSFDLSENVYVLGGNFPPETNVTVHILPDRSPSPNDAVATRWILTTSVGELALTLAWESPLIEGDYDIWVDVNQNGIYEENIDTYDAFVLNTYALSVVPEFPSIIILPLLTLLTFIAVSLRKRIRLKTIPGAT